MFLERDRKVTFVYTPWFVDFGLRSLAMSNFIKFASLKRRSTSGQPVSPQHRKRQQPE